MTLRGISIESHKVKSPDQIYVADGSDNERDYFWDRVIETAEDGSRLPSIGFLQMQSPSMHRSSSLCMDLLRTAVMRSISPEWYGYLDGVHLGHQDQKPTFFSNIGMSLQSIITLAMKKGLSAQFIVCSRSATSRGYCTWRDHNGKIGSFCTVSSVKIKSLDQIAACFKKEHPILSHSSFSIKIERQRDLPWTAQQTTNDPPPLVILATHNPYGTELTLGAISLALACAHQGILTRVVFIEDGVYALIGHHSSLHADPLFNLQELIETISFTNNIEFYSYLPSFRERGLINKNIVKGVVPISPLELAEIMFKSPAGIHANFQRVILF